VITQIAHVPLKHPADDAHLGASAEPGVVDVADRVVVRPVQTDAGGREDAVVLRVGRAEIRNKEVSYFWPVVGGNKRF